MSRPRFPAIMLAFTQSIVFQGRCYARQPRRRPRPPDTLIIHRRRQSSMAAPSWNISGQYFETCSCDYVCPCILGQMAVRPTKGSCTFAMAMQVERGTFGSVPLGGVTFIVLGYTPEEMGKGNWSVGLVVDERATTEQRDAIATIASGAAGGPMAPLSGLIGTFLGVEAAPIKFERNGNRGTVKAGALVDMAVE